MKFTVGDSATFSKTISESDVYQFAGITGDFNPVHIDEVYASNTIFKKRIVHGMLVSSFISTVLASKIPGEGTIYVGQELKFTRPVYIGDTITAKLELIEIINEKRWKIQSQVFNQNGEMVVDGFSIVKPPQF